MSGHRTVIDVYYEDTDCGGVVYYANYLRYFERARTRLLADRGVDAARWMREGALFTVYRAEVDYKGPAMYGDRLIVETCVGEIKGSRLTFWYTVTRERDGMVTATGLTRMACVGGAMKPRRIPDEILERLA